MNKVKLKPEFIGNKYFKCLSKDEVLERIVTFFKISYFSNSRSLIGTSLGLDLEEKRFFHIETRNYYPDIESFGYYYPIDYERNTVFEISKDEFDENYQLATKQLIFD